MTAIIPLRKPKMCNVIEYKDSKLVYRRYASLFFIACIDNDENELMTLEVIQRYVEIMDKVYGNVCELDIIFNFELAYHILDELIIDGVMQESSTSEVLKRISYQEQMEQSTGIQTVYA
ncbi:DEKNAAC102164 [Brettanomyces naardenensis]|uniref:AP complex subunit sigma n=1 Tax=Brettanomyces naardenensis TaxID=13370 RepID=A0A448YJZ5_BRENA|nr:DEKNAAC102164 [Brettanomyces naardenensis]